jgi:hypothetical protein
VSGRGRQGGRSQYRQGEGLTSDKRRLSVDPNCQRRIVSRSGGRSVPREDGRRRLGGRTGVVSRSGSGSHSGVDLNDYRGVVSRSRGDSRVSRGNVLGSRADRRIRSRTGCRRRTGSELNEASGARRGSRGQGRFRLEGQAPGSTLSGGRSRRGLGDRADQCRRSRSRAGRRRGLGVDGDEGRRRYRRIMSRSSRRSRTSWRGDPQRRILCLRR